MADAVIEANQGETADGYSETTDVAVDETATEEIEA